MTSTSERILPRTWTLTAAEVSKLCGRTLVERPATVLVEDVEGLCRGALKAAQDCGQIARDIPAGDWLEVLGFLLGEIARRGRRYDPARRGIEFRPWIYEQLCRYSVVEAQRFLYGRNGQHRIPEDHLAGTFQHIRESQPGVEFGDEPVVRDRLDEASLADPADRVDARGWLDSTADRGDAGDGGVAGGVGGRGVAVGDRGPGVGAGGRIAGGIGRAHWVDCLACGWRNFIQPPNGTPDWHFEGSCSGCGADIRNPRAALPPPKQGFPATPETK